MTIEWSNTLSTGVEWQDRHHKELFKRINGLLDAVSVGAAREEVANILDFLDKYFVVHFEAEERAMNDYNYPSAVAHIREHAKFIEDIAALKKECSSGISGGVVIKVQRKVVDWLIHHIGEVDKALGVFILTSDRENNRID